VLNTLVFSSVGLRVFPRLAPQLRRLYNVCVNNCLSWDIDGEKWLVSQLSEPRVLLDVGFHRGDWTRECARRFPGTSIYGFDPWLRAREFFEAAKLPDTIHFFDLALSNAEETAPFYDYNSGDNSLSRRPDIEALLPVKTYNVRVTTLDAWCSANGVEHVDFLKIDVEGHDLAVLEGARRLMDTQAIDAFTFEYGDAWISSRRFLRDAAAYTRERGYSMFKLFPSFLAPFMYHAGHETFDGATFVGVSSSVVDRGTFPLFEVRGL
jgi:FkbM family methyltransferase